MASIHRRNFGLPSRLRTYPRRRPLLEILDEEIASLLAWCLLIGAGSVALAWWGLGGLLVLIMRGLGSERSLPSPRLLFDPARARFFRSRRDRWYRAQGQAASDEGRH